MDISNGENIGAALFVQGCPSPHCYNCFNPETWDFNNGKEWSQEVKDEFMNIIAEPYIKRITILGGEPLAEKNLNDVLNLVTEINEMYNSRNMDAEKIGKLGILEGGNANERPISTINKSIWIYSGYTWDEIFEESKTGIDDHTMNVHECLEKRKSIISQCDVFVDGRYIDSKSDITLKWRGSSNQRVIDVQKSLQQRNVVLWCD